MNRPNPHDSLGRWVSAYRLLDEVRDAFESTEWLSNAEALRLLEVHRQRDLEGDQNVEPEVEADDQEPIESVQEGDPEVWALAEAIEKLEKQHPDAAEAFRCMHLEGLSMEETADRLQVSRRTVQRASSFARFWLQQELSSDL